MNRLSGKTGMRPLPPSVPTAILMTRKLGGDRRFLCGREPDQGRGAEGPGKGKADGKLAAGILCGIRPELSGRYQREVQLYLHAEGVPLYAVLL
jgi:hypothetical protein